MKSTKIMIEKVKAINPKRLNMLAEKIAKKNNKSVLYVKIDMIKNFLKYKIGYTDYFKSDYINLTKKEKEDYVTSRNFFNILEYLNPREYRVITKDKLVFNKIFKDYLKREFIDVRISSEQEIEKFIKGKNYIFAKPTTDFGGHNIEKIKVSSIKNINQFKKTLLDNKQYLLEEEIIQHKDFAKLNPNTVNTIRLVTLYNDGKVYLIGNSIRISLDENPALACRDLDAKLDENGKPIGDFVDDDGEVYKIHPLTGYEFDKFKKVPFEKEAIEMVKEAALKIPELRYIGWDIAITDNGPVLIEGNEYPSYGLIQNHTLDKNEKGHLKTLREILGDEINNIKLNK